MSYPTRCGPCTLGDHDRHDDSHHGAPNCIGGYYCDCPGGCTAGPNPLLDALAEVTP